jgi:hypothetical protein
LIEQISNLLVPVDSGCGCTSGIGNRDAGDIWKVIWSTSVGTASARINGDRVTFLSDIYLIYLAHANDAPRHHPPYSRVLTEMGHRIGLFILDRIASFIPYLFADLMM